MVFYSWYGTFLILAFIYGSYTNNTENSYSDVDLYLIIDNNVLNENVFIIACFLKIFQGMEL